MARKKKRRTRNLVLGYLENVSSGVFKEYPKEITHLAAKQHGVYALYKGNRLYYVGLASNLKNRVKGHLQDKHKGKWDSFSLYLVRKTDHIRELESLILRIADPKGNKVKGRLPQAENMSPKLKSLLRKAHDEKIKEMFKRARKKKAAKRRGSKKNRRTPALAPFINNQGFQIRATYKGKPYTARVRDDGKIRFRGVLYNSPSLAGKPIINRACNGWSFWQYRNKQGDWVRLDELRKQ